MRLTRVRSCPWMPLRHEIHSMHASSIAIFASIVLFGLTFAPILWQASIFPICLFVPSIFFPFIFGFVPLPLAISAFFRFLPFQLLSSLSIVPLFLSRFLPGVAVTLVHSS